MESVGKRPQLVSLRPLLFHVWASLGWNVKKWWTKDITCTSLSFFKFDPIHSFLSTSKGRSLYHYLHLNSNMGFIHTPCFEKYLASWKAESLSKERNVEKGEVGRTLERDSVFSNLSKCLAKVWEMFIPDALKCFMSTVWKYSPCNHGQLWSVFIWTCAI